MHHKKYHEHTWKKTDVKGLDGLKCLTCGKIVDVCEVCNTYKCDCGTTTMGIE